jgi:hypothetical protein
MATHISTYSSALSRPFAAKKLELFIEKLIPRRCMVVSTGVILVGLSIPFLIFVQSASIHAPSLPGRIYHHPGWQHIGAYILRRDLSTL